jgi:hypothetical protein
VGRKRLGAPSAFTQDEASCSDSQDRTGGANDGYVCRAPVASAAFAIAAQPKAHVVITNNPTARRRPPPATGATWGAPVPTLSPVARAPFRKIDRDEITGSPTTNGTATRMVTAIECLR